MHETLNGRTAVVVGGSSGMGRAVVDDLRAHGARVVSTSRNPSASPATAELEREGVSVVKVDLAHQGPLTALVDSVDSVDFLVLSARDSTLQGAPFRDFPASAAAETINGKVLGYWNVVQQIAPKLTNHASIVLFAGVLSSRPAPGAAATAVANAGVEGLGRALAVELAPVRVNVLSPGLTETAAFSGMDEAERRQWFDDVAQSLPTQRVGHPKDAADAVRFLLTNPHVTGTVLALDGGQRLV